MSYQIISLSSIHCILGVYKFGLYITYHRSTIVEVICWMDVCGLILEAN